MSSVARFFLVCLLLPISSIFAVERDGNTVVETAGIALVKPQPWSKPSEAEVVKFVAFTDRTARGSAGAGYFVLRLPSGKETQVSSSRIVKLIIKPKSPKELVEDSQRRELQKSIDEMTSASAAVPAAGPFLLDYLKPLQEAAARYDADEVMIGPGNWISRDKYRLSEIQRMEFRIRRAINEAPVKKDIDLKSNADFVKLSEIAISDAALKSRLDALETECATLVSREEQEAILAKLHSPLSPAQATFQLDQLKTLASPTARTTSVLKQAGVAAEITSEIEALKQAFEKFWNLDDAAKGVVPEIPSGIAANIESLRSKIAVFHAGSPPEGIWMPASAFEACDAIKNALPGLQQRFTVHDYKAALQGLAGLNPPARQIGPQTLAALAALTSFANSEMAKFSALVDEGNKLAAGPDKKLAAAKFREALAVMPDADLEKRLSELK